MNRLNKKICCIFGAGERTPIPAFPNDRDSCIIIAADGGLGYLRENRISPDFVIGDFDSLGSIPSGENVTVLPCEKDKTDMAEAADIGLSEGCTEFHIYCGTGGRLDHTLANIQLAADIAAKGFITYIYGSGYVIAVFSDRGIELSGKSGSYVSVFSLSDTSEGVDIKGLKYTASGAELTNRFALGVSNEFNGETAQISVKRGTLAVYYTI